ncbi:hypothetical protein [Acinetobacter pittii]|uniref:hypothetical protein n=1 Tax=Acinetobacter pittii TaxID=48296 RepID=UPI000693298D|nr:hypothetical protein [Acinetobacter pittii]
MYIRNLNIKDKNGIIIQDVDFTLGLNIVLGIKDDNTGSTNSLGKTTLLRAIDFCLEGKYQNFYEDDESKNIVNTEVIDFLKKAELIFSIELTKSLKHKSSFNINFSRKLISKPTKKNPNAFKIIHYINHDEVSSTEYSFQLKETLFSSKTEKPTFRQLITKFLRKEDEQISKILRYFPFSSDAEYETIHFTLFGYKEPHEIEKKLNLEKDKKSIKEKIKVIDALKPTGIEQIISVNKATLNQLIEKRDSFKINEKYNYEEDKLANLNQEIVNLNNEISILELNKETLKNRLSIIESSNFKDNSETIELIYKEAEIYNITLQKKFEETVAFHNKMIENERQYLFKRIKKINQDIEKIQDNRIKSTNLYSQLLDELSQNGSLAQYTKLNDEINELSNKIAEDNALQLKSNALHSELEELETIYAQTVLSIEKNIQEFKAINIDVFNEYFSKYSAIIYNQKYVLAFDKHKDIYRFEISAVESNVGSGKKQALVTAFDLAYSAFIQDPRINLPYPRFSTQDKVEIIDPTDLQKLADIAASANCQLIFPLIEDKLLNLDLINSNCLTLTPNKKFFDIENYAYKLKIFQQDILKFSNDKATS